MAEISSGVYSLSSIFTTARPSLPFTTLYAIVPRSEAVSSYLRPMKRLIDVMVRSGFVTA